MDPSIGIFIVKNLIQTLHAENGQTVEHKDLDYVDSVHVENDFTEKLHRSYGRAEGFYILRNPGEVELIGNLGSPRSANLVLLFAPCL